MAWTMTQSQSALGVVDRIVSLCSRKSTMASYYSGNNVGAIVADVGSYATKIGWAGDDYPKSYFRSVRTIHQLISVSRSARVSIQVECLTFKINKTITDGRSHTQHDTGK